MKKIFFLFIFFCHFTSFSQPGDADIIKVTISPVDETTINIYTIVYFLTVTEFYDSEIIINSENNTIDLNLCYHITPFLLEGNVTHDNLIDVTGLTGEYTLNINIFENNEACYLTLLNSAATIIPLPLTEEIILSVSSFELKNNINIYPNPVKNTLQINTKNNVVIKSLHVYDVLGKKLLETNNVTQLDISNLASGLLFIKIKTNKGIITKKVIKE